MQCVDLGGRRIIKKSRARLVRHTHDRGDHGEAEPDFFKQKTAYEM